MNKPRDENREILRKKKKKDNEVRFTFYALNQTNPSDVYTVTLHISHKNEYKGKSKAKYKCTGA
jgi:hypothetical protein